MPRTREMVQVHLQLPKRLRRQLQHNADKHYTSLNAEVIHTITRALDFTDTKQPVVSVNLQG